MNPDPTEILATVLFALAVLPTFSVKRFAHLAHAARPGSIRENVYHFLAETEVVFGLWAAVLFVGIAVLERSFHDAVSYIGELNFNEPKFVLVIMVVAATRPVVKFAQGLILLVARAVPLRSEAAFYLVALVLGPLLGSFITEPAAMTLLAMVLKQRYFERGISARFAYATLGLLFVNVSIGGTLTHFAAPPVLMVAATWDWDTPFMLTHFGWRAAASCAASTLLTVLVFRKELGALAPEADATERVPPWLTAIHLATLGLVVVVAHYPDVMFGVLVLFLGVVAATKEYQDELKLREALLVGLFLSGLVVLGAPQAYWLQPLIESLDADPLFFGATALTAITDNAALTYLASLVGGLSDELKYAVVAGAVAGGGLTVIANAPNPAGVGILQNAQVFHDKGISPLGLFLGALMPTAMAIGALWYLP